MKLKVLPFSLATGVVWGINWFALTWWLILHEGITREITLIGRIYRGFSISPGGSLAALLWGFGDGLLIGFFLSLIYNGLLALFQKE
jgi:hypothetical protein